MPIRLTFFPAVQLRLAALLLVASIFAHSLLPHGSIVDRSIGSAFSAFTMDVSLGPTRSNDGPAVKQSERRPVPAAGGAGVQILLLRLLIETGRPASDSAVAPARLLESVLRSKADYLLPPSRGPPAR